MAGFDSNRFVDLNEREESHLKCGICLNIFNNAVNSQCGHTFCKLCIENWINNNQKVCPECRQVFHTRKRSIDSTENDNSMVIQNYVFNRNLKVNAIVSELKTKCEYEFNGCQEELELGLLSGHLNECEHRFCKICNIFISIPDKHNCFQLMKNERNEWQLKCERSEQLVKEMTEELENQRTQWKQKLENRDQLIQKLMANNAYLEQEYKELTDILMNTTKQMALPLSLLTDYILFGSFKSSAHSLHVFCDGLKVTFVSVNNTEIKLKHNIVIPFLEIEEFIYCSDPSFKAIIIKTNAKHCLTIQKCLHLGTNSPNTYRFDVNSNDPKHWHIMIKMKEMTEGFNVRLIEYQCRLIEPRVKSHAIDLNTIQYMFGNAQGDSSTVADSSSPD